MRNALGLFAFFAVSHRRVSCYTVDGMTILLNPSRDFWKNTYSCFPNSNRSQTKIPTKKSLEFVFKSDQIGQGLHLPERRRR